MSLEELLRLVVALTEESVARECWLEVGAVEDRQWWLGYRQALRDLSWGDGG